MDLVTIFKCFSPAEAQLIRARLEAAGFHPTVADEIAALSMEGYSLSTGGIRIQVPSAEAAEARILIEADEAGSGE